MKTSINLKTCEYCLVCYSFPECQCRCAEHYGNCKGQPGRTHNRGFRSRKGTSNGVVTNLDGQFTLKASGKYPIEVSYMGYVKQVINLKGRTSLNIVMQEDANLLEEVVVSTGYGTQRKADLSGSVVSVSKEDIRVLRQAM